MLRFADNLLYDCRIAIQVDSRTVEQHTSKSPTLALFIAMQEGRISYNDYAMLLIRRCKLVASQPNRGRNRAEGRETEGEDHRRSVVGSVGGGD